MNHCAHVWKAVEEFRRQYIPELHLPVDIFTVVELRLKLDIIPFPALSREYGVDAAVTEDFTGIYIDEESYVLLEKGPEWKQDRLRFSLAHEVGHFVLHQKIAKQLKFKTFADFVGHFNDHNGGRGQLEIEANEFAGRLLVPLGRLKEWYEIFERDVRRTDTLFRYNASLRQSFAEWIAPKFGVNSKTILARLNREGIWYISQT
jgi:Zn-dependent peptidase ImmA (M78 family)